MPVAPPLCVTKLVAFERSTVTGGRSWRVNDVGSDGGCEWCVKSKRAHDTVAGVADKGYNPISHVP
ncbi:hypothetical protein Slin15195_G129520 [Septoria linicola]|uniref:Uncharacterized protein n=1 Tax=Septoria linicola TaxID=215465 RepID=A0A9Q9B614_9PEZI|nr:hypothetical protein Slin15195_G129520 [Septoria linicola]